jgi:cell wall-associated NlpC family hydrolase
VTPLAVSARKYLGVPFRHRGRTSSGLDCAGLALLAYKDLGLDLPDIRIYGREPHKNGLERAVEAALGAPLARAPRVGDVLMFRFDRDPHHVGIAGDYAHGGLSLIHAYGTAGRVVEHRLDDTWRGRIVAVYRRDP